MCPVWDLLKQEGAATPQQGLTEGGLSPPSASQSGSQGAAHAQDTCWRGQCLLALCWWTIAAGASASSGDGLKLRGEMLLEGPTAEVKWEWTGQGHGLCLECSAKRRQGDGFPKTQWNDANIFLRLLLGSFGFAHLPMEQHFPGQKVFFFFDWGLRYCSI